MKIKLLIFLNLIALNCFGLEEAIREDNVSTVLKSLNEGTNVDLTLNVKGPERWRAYTLLSFAAANNALNVAELLINREADINKIDPDAYAPLDRAVNAGNYDMVKLLFKHKANPHTAMSALQLAIKNDDKEMVKLLFENGLRVSHPDIHEATFEDKPSLITSEEMKALLYQKLKEEQQESADIKTSKSPELKKD